MGKPGAILHALFFYACKRLPYLLRFDDADRITVDKKEVVSSSRCHRELANSHAFRGTQVKASVILHSPSCLYKSLIDDLACLFFWLHALRLFPLSRCECCCNIIRRWRKYRYSIIDLIGKEQSPSSTRMR